MNIYQWEEIKDNNFDSLILGNGASIAVNPCFSYNSLFKATQEQAILSESIQKVFQYLEATDFELVLNRLWHAYHINKALEIVDEKTIRAYTEIRNGLISAVQKNHAPYASAQFFIDSTYEFLSKFKTIISLNYDLVLYWAILHGNSVIGNWFKDCFISGRFRDDWETFRQPLGAEGATLVFYPHGNLVLASNIYGEEHKLISGESENLLDRIIQSWQTAESIPLFVSEGDSGQKLKAIKRSSYLSIVYDAVLPKIGNKIAIYGWSLSEQDRHIMKQVFNKSVEVIAVSIYTGHKRFEEEMLRMYSTIKTYNNTAEIIFFDSSSKGCWIQ